MGERISFIAGALLTSVVCAGSLRGQTSKNPISTKPEGTTPTCSYSGSVTDGKVTNSSACQPGVTPGTDPNQIAPLSPAQRFPFPGETPAASANPAAPASTAGQVAEPAPSAAKRFPFPGETPDQVTAPGSSGAAPAKPASSGSPALQDAGSSGSVPSTSSAGSPSSSSSSSTSSSSAGSSSNAGAEPGYSSSGTSADLPDDDPNAPMPTPQRAARKKLPKEKKALTPDEQEAEDVQIAGFYQGTGNFLAAYQRSKEAVSLVADDPEAHVALGDAARKLGKLDEAKSNYQKALALDPVPKIRKAAEKALKEMSGS